MEEMNQTASVYFIQKQYATWKEVKIRNIMTLPHVYIIRTSSLFLTRFLYVNIKQKNVYEWWPKPFQNFPTLVKRGGTDIHRRKGRRLIGIFVLLRFVIDAAGRHSGRGNWRSPPLNMFSLYYAFFFSFFFLNIRLRRDDVTSSGLFPICAGHETRARKVK